MNETKLIQQNKEMLMSAMTKLAESYDILKRFNRFKADLPCIDHILLKITMLLGER
jgi:hypothetical protein